MGLRLYNSLTKKIETFTPINPGEVRYYACGPTVYNYSHIGNLRSYVFADLVKRFLTFKGFKVIHCMNITDVDDKTIRDSQKAGQSLRDYTTFYLESFLEDLKSLNILLPDHMPRATDEIDDMVRMIQGLIDSGHAYRTDKGDVYFRIESFPEYGQLVDLKQSDLKKNAAGRLSAADEYDKEDARDFALWKSWDENDGDAYWKTALGKGRPGWHIECSSMATRYLGNPFDIHSGGIDLKFPHHTNEIAQSECALEGKFVNVWLHHEHLLVDGKKMAKSAGNFFTLRDLFEKGYKPLAIRYELLKTHYRQRSDLRLANLESNLRFIERISDLSTRLLECSEGKSEGGGWPESKDFCRDSEVKFEAALDDDLNISVALSVVHDFVNTANREFSSLSPKDGTVLLESLRRLDSVLGLIEQQEQELLPEEIETLIQKRQTARKDKDFALADQIRDQLLAMGIELKDTADGVTWKMR